MHGIPPFSTSSSLADLLCIHTALKLFLLLKLRHGIVLFPLIRLWMLSICLSHCREKDLYKKEADKFAPQFPSSVFFLFPKTSVPFFLSFSVSRYTLGGDSGESRDKDYEHTD